MQNPSTITPGMEVEMRKPHACGANRWVVLRTGVDIRVQCTQCGRSLLLPRPQFAKAVRKVLRPGQRDDEGTPPSS